MLKEKIILNNNLFIYVYKGFINSLHDNQIFVFGSNPEGGHGAGAAKIAKSKFGAIYGNGHGIQGNSYALITKNLTKGYKDKNGKIYNKYGFKSLTLSEIHSNIQELYRFASLPENVNKEFFIAYQDTKNLNSYTSKEMVRLFFNNGIIPDNIIFSDTLIKYFNPLFNK